MAAGTLLYGAVKRPHPETLEVNQSALASRIVRGMKYSSTCWGDKSLQILFNDSTACGKGESRVGTRVRGKGNEDRPCP